ALVQFDRDLRIHYINPAMTQITGFTLDDLREPTAWQSFVHTEDLPKLLAAISRTRTGQTERLEVRYRTPNGTERIGHVLIQPLFHEGVFVGGTTLVFDMTLQRRLEQELQRSQRLELVGRLASGIAHDFNNLLTVVLSLADLARSQLPKDHSVQDDLRRVVEAGEQAARLAAQLLAFSKHRRPILHPVDVNDVVRQTLDMLRGTLPRTVV